MEWVETTGKTVDEARNRALDQLGVAEDDAEIVVLDEPRAGLFGRVRGEARVRARVRPTTPRPKLDRRDRKRKDAKDAKGGRAETTGDETTSEGPAPKPARAPRAARSSARPVAVADTPAASADQASDDASDIVSDDLTDETSSRPTGQRSRRRGRRGRGGSGGRPRDESSTEADGTDQDETDERDHADPVGDAAATDAVAERDQDQDQDQAVRTRAPRARHRAGRESGNPADADAATPEQRSNDTMVDAVQVGDEARKFVQGVVDAFGLTGTTSVRQDGDDLEVAVDGADLGLLVGPRGTTLQALQELARVAAQRRLGDHDTRLRVDVGGYRERRKEALSRFARQVAEQVVADGTAKRLEPMSSSDRKVIHDELASFEGVVTRSEGDDPRRCVVIAPATA